MANPINVAVLVYPGVEVTDLNGPIDVFTKADAYTQGRFQVFTVAESGSDINTERATVRIRPAYTLDNCPPPDIIVIPGQIVPGSPTGCGGGSAALIAWLQEQARRPGITIMSVCVGAYILANTGLLNGRKATTHWAALEDFAKNYPEIEMIKNVRYVPDGAYVSTGGVTSGIDGALYLIEKIDGADKAQQVADILVYNREAPLPPGTILP